MAAFDLYRRAAIDCNRLIAMRYSTSFSWAIRTLDRRPRGPVCAVYGYVRLADEIVDSFHGYDRADLLARFREDTFRALDERVSPNPDDEAKARIEKEIERDFESARRGIDELPAGARFAVEPAHVYYNALFERIRVLPAARIREACIPVSNPRKVLLLVKTRLGSAFRGLLNPPASTPSPSI